MLEPADDPNHKGNSKRYLKPGKKCATVGCPNTPGTWWSPYWCQPCNGERLRRISGQLNSIMANTEMMGENREV